MKLFKRTDPAPLPVITEPSELAAITPTGTCVIVGDAVSAQLGGQAFGATYRSQPPRRGTAGLSTAPVKIGIGLSVEMAKALQPLRYADVRFAYDRYIAHALACKTDLVLFAGHTNAERTWLVELVKAGRSIVSLRELRLKPSTHPTFRSDMLALIESAATARPGARLEVALPGYTPPEQWKINDLGDRLLTKPKLAEVDIGAPRIAARFLVGPLLVGLAAVVYGVVGVRHAEASVAKERKSYQRAISGIEEEYKKGMPLVERLENRKAFLSSLSVKPDLVGNASRLIQSAALAGDALLVSCSVFQFDEKTQFKLRIALLPDVDQGPIEQATPFIQGLAAHYKAPVRLNKYSDERFSAISPTISFRTYELIGGVAPSETAATVDTVEPVEATP